MDSLTILHAPGYAPKVSRVTVRQAELTRADSIGYSEHYREAGEPFSGYRHVVGRSEVDTRAVRSPCGDAGDNPISVRNDHHLRSVKVEKITSPGLPLKFAPERWGTMARYECGTEVVCHINPHPSPLFTSPWKWRKVMRWVAARVRNAQARGELVVVTGDLQTRAAALFLRGLGLKVWRQGIDYLAYDPRLERLAWRSRTIQIAGFDHPWMLGVFRLA